MPSLSTMVTSPVFTVDVAPVTGVAVNVNVSLFSDTPSSRVNTRIWTEVLPAAIEILPTTGTHVSPLKNSRPAAGPVSDPMIALPDASDGVKVTGALLGPDKATVNTAKAPSVVEVEETDRVGGASASVTGVSSATLGVAAARSIPRGERPSSMRSKRTKSWASPPAPPPRPAAVAASSVERSPPSAINLATSAAPLLRSLMAASLRSTGARPSRVSSINSVRLAPTPIISPLGSESSSCVPCSVTSVLPTSISSPRRTSVRVPSGLTSQALPCKRETTPRACATT